jgi:hypothetical protein
MTMAEHVLSILIKALGTGKATKDLKGIDLAVAHIGATARAGLGAAAGNIAKIGAVAAVGLSAAIKTGIDDLAALENATTAVDGAIKQMGQAGQLTSAQVATWANDIEKNIGAAFDDKAITSATATLIRFGSVTPKNLQKAMTVMTDLAAKTGDVDSAASLLAKALADPEHAAGRLARAGVVLTDVQKKQIKALVDAKKPEQAQAMLLDLIAEKTKGAAAATQGPYQRALSVLKDVSEDARKALAEGFLPILERVSAFLSKKLADPKTLDDIRSFGQGLAGAFDKVLGFAEKVPWDTIKDSMALAGQGAKFILDAFTAMPPWVQTAILTGWGLNKLTGGAVSGIIGELGKGLIKGVLGMNAGVVNINAGVVNGAGGGVGAAAGTGLLGGLGSLITKAVGVGLVGAGIAGISAGTGMGGPAGAAVAAGGGAATIGGAAILLGPIGAIAASIGVVGQTLFQVRDNSAHMGQDIATGIATQIGGGAKIGDLQTSLAAVDQGINDIQANPLNVLVAGDALDQLRAQHTILTQQIQQQAAQSVGTINSLGLINDHMTDLKTATSSGLNAIDDRAEQIRSATASGLSSLAGKLADDISATRAGTQAMTVASTAAGAAAAKGGYAAASAIKDKDLSFNLKTVIPVTNNISVSGRDIVHQTTTFSRAGGILVPS